MSDQMQNEAMERLKQMYSKAPTKSQQSSLHKTLPPQNKSDSENQGQPETVTQAERKTMLDVFMQDKEKSLIVLLLVILMSEKADTMLVLALVYLIL